MMRDWLETLIQEEVDKALKPLLSEEYLDEGGYSKLVRSLAGMEPNINSIGILTAENPMAQQLTPAQNKRRNKALAEKLRDLGYGFYQIQGKYGNVERPYVVPNISKEDAVQLGELFEQDSVIYVEKTNEGSLAQMIETHGDGATVRSKVVLPLADDPEDFYSLYKGRKFVIPFFDDFFQDKALKQGKVVSDE